jgi:hypothetical protein
MNFFGRASTFAYQISFPIERDEVGVWGERGGVLTSMISSFAHKLSLARLTLIFFAKIVLWYLQMFAHDHQIHHR